MDTKTCTKCGETKCADQFRKRSALKDGLASNCKDCVGPDKRTSGENWERMIVRKYGITPDEYFEMLKSQGNRCALCGDMRCQSGKRFAVDHCHTTGKVRGILCYNCNTGLGKFRDNPDVLRKAADYLEK